MLTYRLGFGPPSRLMLAGALAVGASLALSQLVVWAAFDETGANPLVALAAGGLIGAAPGLFIGWLEHRRLGALRTALDGRAPSREAMRAATRGPLPVDEDTRRVARTLVDFTLTETQRQRTNQAVVSLVAVVLGVLFALDDTGWGWALVVLGAVGTAWPSYRLTRLRRRRALLATGEPSPEDVRR